MSRMCLNCQERLRGRADQKFCSDFCRNQFHNQKKKSEHSYLRGINRILKRNRNILLRLYLQSYHIIRLDEVLKFGFDPQYCTACVKKQNGVMVFYCYDMVYEWVEADVKSLQLSRLPENTFDPEIKEGFLQLK
ncbi:MAG: hypothetical protein AAF705_08780 [Bacteroidota bacterium]